MTAVAQTGADTPLIVDRIWVGPIPFRSGRTLRDDFFPTLSDTSKVRTVFRRTDVFKSYIMVLPNEQASREAYDKTVRLHGACLSAGGKAEHLVLQTWHPSPDRTGPEDEPCTVLSIARDIVLRED